MSQFHLVTLGEFKRTVSAAASHTLEVGARETEYGFIVVAHNLTNGVRFTVRHAAKKEPRTWRLDRLCLWLKECGVKNVLVQQARVEV